KRMLENLPRLYEKYAGHDNNRDFFIMNLKESQNIGRQLFVEWIPQIMYNHHQRGPVGSVLAGPPYRDPFNYVFDPLMVTGIDALGAAMINRLNAENKPGFTRLNGSSFSTWYNGGLRTTTHFHNMIGLLTEIIGNPTPENIPLVPARLIPNGATPFPVTPQKWHFKQSIDYSISLNYATLNYAARHADELLFNIYRMGKNSIERGSRNYTTLSPKRAEAINTAYRNEQRSPESRPAVASTAVPRSATLGATASATSGTTERSPAKPDSAATPASDPFGWGSRGGGIPAKYYDLVVNDSTARDPRGYIIPANQADFPTAVKFVNALIKTGLLIHQATADFTVAGKAYPAGSYVVKTDQAFRPHLLDMFEPQDHPNDFQYQGGPPIRPYDAAGWTLAYQMGVQFDRILTGFEGPFKRLPYGEPQSPKGSLNETAPAAGYVLSAKANNSFIAVNELIAAGVEVCRLPTGIAGMPSVEAGSFYVPASSKAKAVLKKAATDFGLTVTSVAKRPTNAMGKVAPRRIALWDTYGGSMPSGWTRFLMEQYHFPIKVIYAADIDAGDLRKNYDVMLFVTRAIPPVGGTGRGENEYGGSPAKELKAEELPAEYRPTLGKITADKSIPQLKKFMEAGGTVVTIGSSTNLAYHLGLPVKNALVEMTSTGTDRPLPAEKYFVPGSILRVTVDSTQQATWGMANQSDVYFDSSPVFKLAPDAISKGLVKPLAWFSTNKPLRSGWAWGQSYLQDGVAAFMAPVGAGRLYAFGPEITFRAQAHGTFKLLFNELYSMEMAR
ncbi:MAG: peptidase, partial [Bacteroidetes bacterium]|nr:peptidase [Fibrella sp.]